MKNHKHLFLIALSLTVCMSGKASFPDGGERFNVYTKGSSNAVVYQLDDLEKMTFGDNALSLYMKAGKTDYAYGSLVKITFDGLSDFNGIEQLRMDSGNLDVSYDNLSSVLHIESLVSLRNVTVYDIQGYQRLSVRHEGKSFDLSLDNLAKGVYVILIKGEGIDKSIKIIK